MAQVQVRDTAGSVVSTVEISDGVFGVERNDTLIHQAVLRIQANRRRGTHDTKTRGEVRGTTAKWYRQKGTGRARHGAQTAPQFRKGGVVFGPHPRSYQQSMPQKMRRKALCSVLSDKLSEGRVHVIAGFEFVAPRTKDMIAVLKALGVERRILIILPSPDVNVAKSARNIPDVRITMAHTLNVVEAIDGDHLIFTQAAMRALEGMLTNSSQPSAAVHQSVVEHDTADSGLDTGHEQELTADTEEPVAVNGVSNGIVSGPGAPHHHRKEHGAGESEQTQDDQS